MLYLVVIVTEGIIKCVLPERIITITENEQFSELYEIFTSGQFNNQNVKVYVRQNRVDKWVEVSDGLNSDLKIMEVLGYNHVNFSLITESIRDIDPVNLPDAFDLMMKNARQLKLLQHQYSTMPNILDVIYYIMRLLIFYVIKKLVGKEVFTKL